MATREEVKQDIYKVETSLKEDMSKIDAKFDKIQWLIVAIILTVVFKDYLFLFLQSLVP